MIIEGEFFAGGHLRWNLGWPTPNYAGAFIVTLVVLCWSVGASRWRWAVLAVEVSGLFLLAKTYSRGAVVAWGLAWLFGVIASRGWRTPGERLFWSGRAVILALMMSAVGFGWSRANGIGDGNEIRGTSASNGPTDASPSGTKPLGETIATGDGSVVNRLALWRGGLKMVAEAPLTGWAAGESGRAYMNWFQDLDRTEGYSTMVNSYLHVAVEHGLPALGVVFFGLAGLLAVAWCGARDELGLPVSRRIHLAAGASTVAWAVANVFTTLWIDPKLWIVPGLVGGWLLWKLAKGQGKPLARIAMVSAINAVFAMAALYGAGRWLGQNDELRIRPGPDGTTLVGSVTGKEAWDVWTDPVVLGPAPGKELRRWATSSFSSTQLVVHSSVASRQEVVPSPTANVMLVGRQAERATALLSANRHLWLIHPLGPPPHSQGMNARNAVTVLLPEIDEKGNGPAWRRWATEVGARVIISPGSGLDIRALWPEILRREFPIKPSA